MVYSALKTMFQHKKPNCQNQYKEKYIYYNIYLYITLLLRVLKSF